MIKRLSALAFVCLVMVSLASCKRNQGEKETHNTLFQLTTNTGIDFRNTVKNNKGSNIFNYRNFYNGGGVAIGDINNDGLADIFFTANMGSNKLYLNKGDFTFEDISESSGFRDKKDWSTGVVFADVNGDGWLDIYVCNAGFIDGKAPANNLFINNHDLTFTDSAAAYGLLNEGGYCTHAAFFDYDLDGDLDCYMLNNSFIPVNTLNYANKRTLRAKDWPIADFLKGGGDKLLRNDNGAFVDVSEEAGIYGSLIGFGLGVTVGDVNNDLYPDIYVSNDFFEKDYLYINQHNGSFKEELEQRIQHISHSSMGADMADLNNDGFPEIFVTEMLPGDETRFKTTASFENIDIQKLKVDAGFYHQYMQNTLQVNNGDGSFSETGFYSGVAATDWSWGGLIFDADNDGLTDIFVCNGIYNDLTDQDFIDFFANDIIQKMALTGKKEEIDEIIKRMPSIPIPNKAFHNHGNMKFTDRAAEWGLDQPSFSNGAAYGDLDNDGDPDLVVNNVNGECFIYRNRSRELNQNNFIGVHLRGIGTNTFAVGSTVKVFSNGETLTRELIPGRGFQSSVDYGLLIGTGKGAVDSMIIIWPDRSYETIHTPRLNQYHTIRQQKSAIIYQPRPENYHPLLKAKDHSFDKHEEDDHIDFYMERNVPRLLSQEGPRAAVGDVNGDHLDDIYICGAAGKAGRLYLQTAHGFIQQPNRVFDQYAEFEDVASLLFDCDKDGDLDLFVGSGGNNHPAGSRELLDRLYKNDGQGNFSIDVQAFKDDRGMNTACVMAEDFDNDGDQDLFVGSRSFPQHYGETPRSYLYVNDGNGRFHDMAETINPEISLAGMITGAVWTDVTNDGKNDLVIVGEWMAPRTFTFNGSRFAEVKTNLDSLFGWWQTVASTDIDGDGDKDLILGNVGENFYLQPSQDQPVKLWSGDFDENDIADKIITRTVNGRDMPVFLKRELTDQLPGLKKQNLKHMDYAGKSIQDLFSKNDTRKATTRLFNYASSCIAFNDGKGNFSVKPFGPQVQLSSVNAIYCTDVNSDSTTDLVMGGNLCGFLPQFCRVDASYGQVLLNDGNGNLQALSSRQSGLFVRGEVRDLQLLQISKQPHLLFLQNNDKPLLYRLQKAK